MKVQHLVQHLVATLALTLGASAFAQAPGNPVATPNINQRQANQENRINQGIASGALTQKEAASLNRREAKIQSDKLAAKADGKVTVAERRKLRREQNRASAAIKRQKRDRQTTMPATAR